jgi:hypothetical protein
METGMETEIQRLPSFPELGAPGPPRASQRQISTVHTHSDGSHCARRTTVLDAEPNEVEEIHPVFGTCKQLAASGGCSECMHLTLDPELLHAMRAAVTVAKANGIFLGGRADTASYSAAFNGAGFLVTCVKPLAVPSGSVVVCETDSHCTYFLACCSGS